MPVIRVDLGDRAYEIVVAPGARGIIGAFLAKLSDVRRAVVIADRTVARLHGAALAAAMPEAAAAEFVEFEPGENAKSLVHATRLYDELARRQLGRRDLIIAFGGGVAGDLGGFVAGTWLRGVRLIQVPTTLEAAIDASIGGKTGLNHPAGKNLIGVFHQPAAVFIDIDFLRTLPQRDLVAGLAESVKHAVVRDGEFLGWHERNVDAIAAREPDVLTELIARNCAIKAAVVAADEREAGLRMVLNYGHTAGHAIEHLMGYEMRHGECVGLGMLVANHLAVRRRLLDAGTATRIAELIERLGLPARLPRAVEIDALLARMRMDKKVTGGAVQFILPRGLGAHVRVGDVSATEIAEALAGIAPA